MHAKKARPSTVTEPHHNGLVEDLFKLVQPSQARQLRDYVLQPPRNGRTLAAAGVLPQDSVADGGHEYNSWRSL